jgi:trimethylamine--corrinoid protein Co-methyltransferase
MNTEYYYPHSSDRRRRQDWDEAGGKDMWQVAREKARQILDEHEPEPIPSAVDAAIRERFEILLPQELASVT